MLLSVIIPTHNRSELLRQCLQTLGSQQVDPESLEVIVIDDGSPQPVADAVAQAAADSPVEIRCVRQAMAGLNSARNRGVELAAGEVVAFLDDDTLVDPGWAQAMLEAFASQPCAAVGGRIRLGLPKPAPAWLLRRGYYLSEYDRGEQAGWIEDGPLPVGANCAVRRRDLAAVGGFRDGLDRIGRSLVSNGDTEFFRRLRAAGGRLRYEPRAVVIHQIPLERMSVAYFDRRHFAQGVSDELLDLLESGGRPTLRHRLRLAGGVLDAGRTALTAARRGGRSLEARFEAHYWTGRLAGSLQARRVASLPPTAGAAPTDPVPAGDER